MQLLLTLISLLALAAPSFGDCIGANGQFSSITGVTDERNTLTTNVNLRNLVDAVDCVEDSIGTAVAASSGPWSTSGANINNVNSGSVNVGTTTASGARLYVFVTAGSNGPIIQIASGTTKLFEVTGASVTVGDGVDFWVDGSSITRSNFWHAFATCVGTGTVVCPKMINISTVTRPGTGILEATMIIPMPDNEYPVFGTPMVDAGVTFAETNEDEGHGSGAVYTKTRFVFRVRSGTTAGTETNFFRISFGVPKL